MRPSIGRIVHYKSYGTPAGEFEPKCRAAIVADVWLSDESKVDLVVLNPGGMFFNQSCYQDEDTKAGGTWHWPEQV